MPIIIKIALSVLLMFVLQACKQSEAPIENAKNGKLKEAAVLNTQLGMAYLKQGNIPRARKKLLTALSQDSVSADVHGAMAYLYSQTKEYETANAWYLKAIALAPQSGEPKNNYGAFLCARKQFESAESWFKKAVEDSHYINSASAMENAGICAEIAGKYSKAEKWLKKALNHDPARKKALYVLLNLMVKQEKTDRAITFLEKYAELIDTDSQLINLAKTIAKKEHRVDLESYYIKKIRNFMHNSGVNNEYNSING